MILIDVILIICILVGGFTGYREGLIVSIFSLLAVIIGVLLGFKLMGHAIAFLMGRFEINDQILPFVAFGLVFLLVVLCVNLLGRILKASVGATFFGVFDQIAGSIFGALKTVFMLSVMLWIAESLHLKIPQAWRADSSLLPFVSNVAPSVSKWISSIIPYFSNTF